MAESAMTTTVAARLDGMRSATAAMIHEPGKISSTLTLEFQEMSFGDSRIGSAK